ncbi:hypothetical protein NQ314_004073 [Rhamnusium bicolor]|uniref:Uncharacterized protein n=1 Tax=Rhamnusium bicolor TaxID=1586634 RepID=A0AAV8ZK35_9CUCU|nr:hypothetical protein NQ314_004073 [Rhamnusium bicolor]
MGITKTTRFPLKFCQTRWVEGSEAANRALDIFDNIKKYVNDPSVKLPHSTSAQNVIKGLSDPLLPAKIAFFDMVASTLEPFLIKFQSDAPLAPFIYSELSILLVNLLQKFINEGYSQ